MEPGFVEYQRRVVANAQALAESLQENGFRIVSGGTDSHLLLAGAGPGTDVRMPV